MNYSDIEQFWADAMPAYAARENAACAQHLDHSRLGSGAGKQGTVGGRMTRVAELTELLRANPELTLLQIAAAMDLSRTMASNYLAAIRARGELAQRKVAGLYRYSLKEPQP